ncbi:hypothetical protein [Ruegeria marina]|uniref:hypothetical protein n=1 Tax=Ruegeria marina TaxID=639004 RepID=UPI001160063D|nr:hypothetical protein [Ruegeria marina]
MTEHKAHVSSITGNLYCCRAITHLTRVRMTQFWCGRPRDQQTSPPRWAGFINTGRRLADKEKNKPKNATFGHRHPALQAGPSALHIQWLIIVSANFREIHRKPGQIGNMAKSPT